MKQLALRIFPKIAILFAIVTVALLTNYLFAAWSPAPPNPPTGNVATPLNVGSNDQVKNAGLNLLSLIVNGPTQIVGGPLYIQDGSEGADKVLVSDASGQATWRATSTLGFGSGSTSSLPPCSDGNYLVYNGTDWQCSSDEFQLRIEDACPDGKVIQSVNSDGTVVCEDLPPSTTCLHNGVAYSTGAECAITISTVDTCRHYTDLYGWHDDPKVIMQQCETDGTWGVRKYCTQHDEPVWCD